VTQAHARLIVQPGDGFGPVLSAIRHASRAIDLAIFRLRAGEVVQALHDAVARGVEVRALVTSQAPGEREHLREGEEQLLASGVIVARSAGDLARYHGKYLIVDDELLLLGFNFTKKNLRTRSFGVRTAAPDAVREARRLFEADMARQPFTPADRSPLAISPETSRERLSRFITRAKRSLSIYDKLLDDSGFVSLIEERAASGVAVRVLGRAPALERSVPVRALADLKLHVRTIVRDESEIFVGSQGLRGRELDARREVGLFSAAAPLVAGALQVFDEDWVRSERPGDDDREEALDFAGVS
jgi:phosphatidylserine/phosphatidylglycerophosphate/cardiolipin synthase-like enzyme